MIDLPIPNFKLSCRAMNFLRDNEINTLNQLASYTSKVLMSRRGCGAKTIRELRKILLEHGLSFSNEEPIQDLKTLNEFTDNIMHQLKWIEINLKNIEEQFNEIIGQINYLKTYQPKLPDYIINKSSDIEHSCSDKILILK